uniref:Uncharacterized protein n=1 Tax=Cannabis sativa TaxID=3483 RepID=A0A803NVU4_CANSA
MDPIINAIHNTLSLTEEEGSVFTLPEEAAASHTSHSSHMFIARVLTDSYVHNPSFIDQMSGHWKGRFPAVISAYGEDMFKALAKALGNLIGEYVDVHEDSLDEGWEPFLRIRVKLMTNKPLPRGRMISLPKVRDEFWIDFRYERLPEFCFECGILGHPFEKCIKFMERMDNGNDNDLPYGPWMKGSKLPSTGYDNHPTTYSHSTIALSTLNSTPPPPSTTLHSNKLPPILITSQHRPTPPPLTVTSSPSVPQPTSQTHSDMQADYSPSVTNLPGIFTPDIGSASRPFLPIATYPPTLTPSPFKSASLSAVHTAITPIVSTSSIVTAASNKENYPPTFVTKRQNDTLSMRKFLKRCRNQNASSFLNSVSRFRQTLNFANGLESPRSGLSGGLLLLWHQNIDVTLLNFVFKGDPFTWIKNRSGWSTIKERLDWCFVNHHWENQFQAPGVLHLDYFSSNHRAITASFAPINSRVQHDKRRSRFRFENLWLSADQCKDIIAASWKSSSTSDPISAVLGNLDECAANLQKWHIDKYGNMKKRITDAQLQVETLNNSCHRTPTAMNSLKNSEALLDELLEQEEIYWQQRSRFDWLNAGDRNTKFLHAKASKIKIFIWRAFNDALPVAIALVKRKIITNSTCSICQQAWETAGHALFSCNLDRTGPCGSWSQSQTSKRPCFFCKKLLAKLLLCNQALFLTHRESHPPRSHHASLPQISPAVPLMPWTPPPLGMLKMNVDAALDSTGKITGIGALIRSSNGEVVAAISKPVLGCYASHEMEAIAMFHCLNWAIQLQLLVSLVETDALRVSNALCKSSSAISSFQDLIVDITSLLSFFPNVNVSHVKRLANMAANGLAKFALGVDEACYWSDCIPPPINSVIVNDYTF